MPDDAILEDEGSDDDLTLKVIQRAQSAYAKLRREKQGLLKTDRYRRSKSAHPKHVSVAESNKL